MPLSAINVARFIALENKLSKLWHLINIKRKEETTDFKNSTFFWEYVKITVCQIRNISLGSYPYNKD